MAVSGWPWIYSPLSQSPGAKCFLQPTTNSWTACTPLQLQQRYSCLWQADCLNVDLVFIGALPLPLVQVRLALGLRSRQCQLAASTSRSQLRSGFNSGHPPIEVREQTTGAFRTSHYHADSALRHGHATSPAPDGQCGRESTAESRGCKGAVGPRRPIRWNQLAE